MRIKEEVNAQVWYKIKSKLLNRVLCRSEWLVDQKFSSTVRAPIFNLKIEINDQIWNDMNER